MFHFEKTSHTQIYLIHCFLLSAGFLVGVLMANKISLIPFDFSGELAEAKRQGIVSLTILNDYPKSRDIVQYAALILLPTLFALGTWWVWARKHRAELAELFYKEPVEPAPKDRSWKLTLLCVCLVTLYITFDINSFHGAISGWSFLAETGEFLAWVQFIIDGGVYARDFFCLYGPLMVYLPAWVMIIFGDSMVTYWSYDYVVTLITHGLILFFLYNTIKNRTVFICASLFCLLISPTLRFVLGVIPLVILYNAIEKDKKLPGVISGIALALSLLFSQEAGLCGGIAVAMFLILEARRPDGFRLLCRQTALVAGGCFAVLIPVLVFFYYMGALARFFDSIYGYPKLITLGYGALPFPPFSQFLAAPFSSGIYYPFWIIGVYLFTAITLSVSLYLKPASHDTNFRVAILIFGLFLYRVALGRSDFSHIHNSSLPAFLLTYLTVDDLVLGSSVSSANFGRKIRLVILLLSLGLLFVASNCLRDNKAALINNIASPVSKFTFAENGVKIPELPRGGAFFDQNTADELRKLKAALDRYTKDGDEVLFFPNEPAYYFLFKRRCPTRYVIAYFTASAAQRREMVAELEQKRLQYVVYSRDTWRIDDIPESVQVPEIVSYLNEKYSIVEDLGSKVLLRRRPL